jgi:chaperonin GroES
MWLTDFDLDEPLKLEVVAETVGARPTLIARHGRGHHPRFDWPHRAVETRVGRRVESSFRERGIKIMAASIRPLHDRVLILRLDEEVQAHGGIIIPDTAKEKPQQGEVVAVGLGKLNPDGTRQHPDVREGDRVLFGKHSGSDVILDGEEYLIMREKEIFGVFTPAAKSKSSGR